MPLGSVLAESKKTYSRRARLYWKFFGIWDVGFRIRSAFILRLLEPSDRGTKVLDAGCGNGILSLTLAKAGMEVVGVDISNQQISDCQAKAQALGLSNVNFLCADLCDLDLADGSFDKVVCADVIEHIPDDKRALDALVRVLRHDGTLVLSTVLPSVTQRAFLFRAQPELHGHVREGYTKEQLFRLIESTGLRIERLLYSDRLFERLAWEADQLVKRHIRVRAVLFPILLLISKLDRLLPLAFKGNNITVKACKVSKVKEEVLCAVS